MMLAYGDVVYLYTCLHLVCADLSGDRWCDLEIAK